MREGDGTPTPRRGQEPPPGWPPTRPYTTPPASPDEDTTSQALSARGTRPARRAKRGRRTWWIAPFLSGAIAVLAVTAIVQLTVLRHPAKAAASASPAAPLPAEMFPDALFSRLTQDVQHQNETDFLSLVAPGARPAVRIWWENQQAIGFTTGLVMPTANGDVMRVNSHLDGTTTILAGTHSPLDPSSEGKPDVPLERYEIGLHFATPTAIGEITSWKPLGDDPWDQGTRLYVRKASNVVVAGPPSDKALVNETLPIAQAAASYDVGLMNHVNPGDLHQLGFVVFVSGNAAVRDGWFAAGQQLPGWPPSFFGGFTSPLFGPGASADTTFSIGDVSDGTTGGARVVITPYEDQSGGTAHLETTELVQHFMLDILAADDQDLAPELAGPAPVPSWAIEGLAVAVQSLYAANDNPAPGTYDFTVLDDELKTLPASYRDGQVPTSQQLFTGPVATQENWNDVAASVYEYIAKHHGMNQMLAAASLLWTMLPTPFGNVLAFSSGETFGFFTQAAIESGWKAALAQT